MSTFKLIINLFKTFPQKRKLQLLVILILQVISGLAEALLISSFLAFLNGIINIDVLYNSDKIKYIRSLFNIDSPNELIIFLGILFIFILLIASIARLSNYGFAFKFSSLIGTELSYLSFKNKLYEPYASNIEKDKNTFLNLMASYISRIIAVIEQFLLLIASTVILLSILISLLFIDFKLTSTLFITIFFIYYLIISFVGKRLSKNSKKEIELSTKKVFILREGINSIREILINNTQEFFLKSFLFSESKLQNIIAYTKFVSISPKVFLEAIGLTIISFVVLILSISSGGINAYIPIIGTMTLAAIRLITSFQTVYTSWATILAGREAIFEVTKLLKSKNINQSNSKILLNKINDFNQIEFSEVSYKYPNTSKFILNKLNFTLYKGEKIAIVGRTGSGKSTFIDIFASLIFPTNGEIIINKKYKQKLPLINNWQSLISYVSQSIYISDRSLIENIAYGVEQNSIDIKRIQKIGKIVLLDEFLDMSDMDILNKSLGDSGIKLSGGQRQRVALARAIYKDFKILILDEATSALDISTEDKIISNLLESYKDLSIIMVSHRINSLRSFDKIFEIKNGKLKRYS
tara:strand:+ start:873 stop:2615 length:1743 start_codon:yes stop_codon:yes gene_type:complete